jgi:hypothetical protein
MEKTRLISALFVSGALAVGAMMGCGSTDSSVGGQSSAVNGATCNKVDDVQPAKDGCNTCSCSATGKWVCSTIACEGQCKSGETKPAGDGCNTCGCGTDGRWACTAKACAECKPGETKTLECNSCSCDSTGLWTCTAAACDPVCKAGDVKVAEDGCNSCTCTSSGTWACTDKACATTCKPGEIKPSEDGCNTCSCAMDGSGWLCTAMACDQCPPPAKETGACTDNIVHARDPNAQGITCCTYASPCEAPAGWTQYGSRTDCTGGGGPNQCAPARIPSEPVECPLVITWGLNPENGACCQYPSPCQVPDGYKPFPSGGECEEAAN